MGIDSPFGWWGGSVGGIVLFELLDSYITQKLVDVGRKKDGSGDLHWLGLPVGWAVVGFVGAMVETLGGLLRLVVNKILSKVQKSFWSCTHVNCCQITHYISIYIFY